MTTQQVISNLASWLREQTATLKFKRASEYNESQAEGYKYALVTPAVYELQLPINAAEHTENGDDVPITAPAIIVASGGESTLDTATGRVTTRISLKVHTWNPGQHLETVDGESRFIVDGEGWRDCVTLIDAVTKRLEEAEFPAGCSLTGDIISSYPDGDDNPFYPYYIGFIQFELQHLRRPKENKFNI